MIIYISGKMSLNSWLFKFRDRMIINTRGGRSSNSWIFRARDRIIFKIIRWGESIFMIILG